MRAAKARAAGRAGSSPGAAGRAGEQAGDLFVLGQAGGELVEVAAPGGRIQDGGGGTGASRRPKIWRAKNSYGLRRSASKAVTERRAGRSSGCVMRGALGGAGGGLFRPATGRSRPRAGGSKSCRAEGAPFGVRFLTFPDDSTPCPSLLSSLFSLSSPSLLASLPLLSLSLLARLALPARFAPLALPLSPRAPRPRSPEGRQVPAGAESSAMAERGRPRAARPK